MVPVFKKTPCVKEKLFKNSSFFIKCFVIFSLGVIFAQFLCVCKKSRKCTLFVLSVKLPLCGQIVRQVGETCIH